MRMYASRLLSQIRQLLAVLRHRRSMRAISSVLVTMVSRLNIKVVVVCASFLSESSHLFFDVSMAAAVC